MLLGSSVGSFYEACTGSGHKESFSKALVYLTTNIRPFMQAYVENESLMIIARNSFSMEKVSHVNGTETNGGDAHVCRAFNDARNCSAWWSFICLIPANNVDHYKYYSYHYDNEHLSALNVSSSNRGLCVKCTRRIFKENICVTSEGIRRNFTMRKFYINKHSW